MWQCEIRHEGLGKYRCVKGETKEIAELKAASQSRIWDEMWQKKLITEKRKAERDADSFYHLNEKALAAEKMKEAESALADVTNILKYALECNDAVNWDDLVDKSEALAGKPVPPKLLAMPSSLQLVTVEFPWVINFVDRLFPLFRIKKDRLDDAERTSRLLYEKWKYQSADIEQKNKKLSENYQAALKRWEQDNKNYLKTRDENNKELLRKKEQYLKKDPDAVVDYCEIVLSKSHYPETFPQQFDVEYKSDSKVLVVDYFLPSMDKLPKLKEVKYIASKNDLKETHLSEKAFNEMYDDVLYKITLRTIHELYEADVIGTVDLIIFNGYVKFIDKGTGKEATACILSLQAHREEFLSINLANIDPKECFKKLKGIGSSKLYGLAPIAPIMQISREDKRFVTPYAVVGSVDETTNLAAMDWQDFENLIREIFEKEFSVNGGEVKITRASRDEGVDAVAFDPDPIRGGKIVIQAKRYTNIVGVSAVRDLYGTVMNEGAIKGILVTTTDYGPDAYKFAQNKPLTLLNGSNLLHLLEKYGHKAKIDIKEARKVLNLKDRDEHKNY